MNSLTMPTNRILCPTSPGVLFHPDLSDCLSFWMGDAPLPDSVAASWRPCNLGEVQRGHQRWHWLTLVEIEFLVG